MADEDKDKAEKVAAAKKRAIKYIFRKPNFPRAFNQGEQEDKDSTTIITTLEATGSAFEAEDGLEGKDLAKRQ